MGALQGRRALVSFLVPGFVGFVTLASRTGGTATVATEGTERGSFTLLTYNVAGLPILVSQSEPIRNMPRIGQLLNLYDVALVQEDFAYHESLHANSKHQYRSVPVTPDAKVGIGDGLNLFSRLPFSSFERVTWRACHGRFSDGSDCFAAKGFTFATEEVAPNVTVDVYNLHMDSGSAAADIEARSSQVEQLLTFMDTHSANHPVLVAGDTNMGSESESQLLSMLKRAGLQDACRTLACGRPHLIDRVMYRSSATISLRVTSLSLDARFVREDGKNLSDHEALGAVIQWARERRVAKR
jgi:endonuclease/exonuclease/phosphatase family metal-dependent hydrolase